MASALEDSAQPASGGEIPPLTTATRYWYGLGQGAEGIKNQAFTLFLLFYYTQVLGLSGALAGLAVAALTRTGNRRAVWAHSV